MGRAVTSQTQSGKPVMTPRQNKLLMNLLMSKGPARPLCLVTLRKAKAVFGLQCKGTWHQRSSRSRVSLAACGR